MSVNYISEQFLDFDHFRSVLSGWDVDVTQLSRGALQLNWSEVVFDNQLMLSHLKSNRSLADRMAIDSGYMKFVVCFTPNVFCGLEVPGGSMLIFAPGREYRNVLPAGFESFEICASNDFLREMGLEIGDHGFGDLYPENCVLSIGEADLKRFRLLSQTLSELTMLQNHSFWIIAARERAISLTVGVLEGLGRTNVPDIENQISGWLLTVRALNLIDEQGSQPATIAEISTSIGCTSRALQVAFQSSLGVTPLQYKLAKRLQFTRYALLTAQPDNESVTRIAVEHEFFHFGRFSQYYKALFGESPSVTLKRVDRVRSGLR